MEWPNDPADRPYEINTWIQDAEIFSSDAVAHSSAEKEILRTMRDLLAPGKRARIEGLEGAEEGALQGISPPPNITTIWGTMETAPLDAHVQRLGCRALRTLHSLANRATQFEIIERIACCMETCASEAEVQIEGVHAFATLAAEPSDLGMDIFALLGNSKVMGCILRAMESNATHLGVQLCGCLYLTRLRDATTKYASSPPAILAFSLLISSKVLDCLVFAMESHPSHRTILTQGFGLAGAIIDVVRGSVNNDESSQLNAYRLFGGEFGAHSIKYRLLACALQAMEALPSCPDLQLPVSGVLEHISETSDGRASILGACDRVIRCIVRVADRCTLEPAVLGPGCRILASIALNADCAPHLQAHCSDVVRCVVRAMNADPSVNFSALRVLSVFCPSHGRELFAEARDITSGIMCALHEKQAANVPLMNIACNILHALSSFDHSGMVDALIASAGGVAFLIQAIEMRIFTAQLAYDVLKKIFPHAKLDSQIAVVHFVVNQLEIDVFTSRALDLMSAIFATNVSDAILAESEIETVIYRTMEKAVGKAFLTGCFCDTLHRFAQYVFKNHVPWIYRIDIRLLMNLVVTTIRSLWSEAVQTSLCGVLYLFSTHAYGRLILLEAHAFDDIVRAMRLFPTILVQVSGCVAMKNLAASVEIKSWNSLDTFRVLFDVIKQHSDNINARYSALEAMLSFSRKKNGTLGLTRISGSIGHIINLMQTYSTDEITQMLGIQILCCFAENNAEPWVTSMKGIDCITQTLNLPAARNKIVWEFGLRALECTDMRMSFLRSWQYRTGLLRRSTCVDKRRLTEPPSVQITIPDR
jgi:hypothetical protein